MSETQARLTGSFRAADEKGNHYTVNEFTVFEHTTTFDTANDNSKEGLTEYKLANGASLNRISETQFEIISDGTVISKVV